ncbi:MAG: hypothetical protein E6H05_08745 [Bacillati bacterium ANGP1]|uniref:DUF5666 domain-containing protein n=1 Tax=Candidatus Segetimicrobium genomatis TaxID=2569760 RepID=A0A537IT44_9BACT|nr:MAG: hypothetical protein E6H05_08745 [Terrabacteria group bacterium ANGP1]
MRLRWSCRATVIALVALLGLSVWPSRAQALSFGGEATGVQLTVPAAGITIKAATGQLPPAGGGVEASLLSGDIPGSATGGAASLAADSLHSVAVGLQATDAAASMGTVSLTVSGNGITTDFLMARSAASCGPGPAVAGSSELPNLVINGQAVTVTGAPNQTVSLPNGTATINEQTSAVAGSSGELRVVALHVTTIDAITQQVLADVMLGITDAMIDCQPGSPPSGSFGTGGGNIVGNNGTAFANFGVVGGIQPDESRRGHVVFDDHSMSFSMKSTAITSVDNSVPCQTTINGDGDASGVPVTFIVTIRDNGEPGGGRDTFSIQVFGVPYTNSNTVLRNGNIQKHGETCP